MSFQTPHRFDGLKVVEFANVLAGPAVGMFFAELGAEVVKIEHKRGGDITRGWKLPAEDPQAAYSAYFCSVNWGKTHLFLDLDDAADQARAQSLALAADIVIANFKPSAARRFGLDAAALRAANPALIYGRIQAFADPDDDSPAFDALLQAETGFMHMCGDADGPPVKMPVALIDLLAAHQLKEGLLLALLRRGETGEGCEVSVSLLESALASLANQASNYLMTGHIPGRMGARHPNIAPYGDMYACADGALLLLAVGSERQFESLCRALGREEWISDARFARNEARVVHRQALNDALGVVFLQKKRDEWLARLKTAGVPAARIRDMREVFDMPEARALILEDRLPDGATGRRLRTNVFKKR